MNVWIYLALMCVLVCFEETQSKQWCYTRTKHYSRNIDVPVRICRQIKSDTVKTVLNPVGTQFNPVKVVSPSSSGSVTAKQYVNMFPGLFLTKTKADEIHNNITTTTTRTTISPAGKCPGGCIPPPQHDGDLHCPTFKRLEAAPGNLMNVNKEMKEIVHFSADGVYQYVHTGKCGPGSTQSCTGGCYLEKSTVFLMVWQPDSLDWPTTFDAFEVDSYCSCKGITP